MSQLSPDAWRAVSPYLDQALELEEEQRTAWLESLRRENPSIALQLQTLLDDYRVLRSDGFLNQTPSLPSHSALAGQLIGAYKLVAPIGEGGMGSVWLAERGDGRFERSVALKFLKIALVGRGVEERFKREGKILGRLSHPHVAQLLDAGVSEKGQPFLVLEHVEGEHIDQYCDRRKLDVDARIALFLEVLAAVAHAHSSLIVHRDLKPSNVLVNTDGHVKLLDFGIAKLLEDEGQSGAATVLTREAGSAMTLLYAAPEQVMNGNVTTATDVYALGVMLYVLFAGQHPAGPGPHSPADVMKNIVDTEPPRLSDAAPDKLRRRFRGDLDTIVAKALKKNPQERYISVSEFADDLRRHLNHEPIGARPDTVRYRVEKFVRRHRTAVALASLAVIATIAGIVGTVIQARAANRERIVAQRRFNEVRQLANRLFDVDRQVRELPGGAKTRQLIVDTSLDYLARLSTDARSDPALALDLGTAYMRVGRVQGVPISSNLGQPDNAEKSLRIAEELIGSVLRAQPSNRIAFLRAAQIAHDRMVLAQARRPDTEALPLARQSQSWLEKYLSTGSVDAAEKDQVVIIGMNVANWLGRQDSTSDGLLLLRRTIEIAKATSQPRQAGAAQINVARLLRSEGRLDEALAAIREGVRLLEPRPGDTAVGYGIPFGLALVTQGEVLGEDNGISMGRFQEAAEYFERGYQVALNVARKDSADADSRLRVSTRGIRLAGVLRRWDPARAVAVYDEVLARLAEVKNNSRARRDEARALAGSTHPLRQLGRSAEARRRLDAAFALLRELKMYPADDVKPRSEPFDALCALAELEAATGKIRQGIEIYQNLSAKLVASTPKPEDNLEVATDLSNLHRALSRLHTRAGQPDLAASVDARRVELWRHWERKLPNNAFVRSQIAAAMGNSN